MNPSEPAPITCPYCGAAMEVVVDISAGDQEYIEDCQVCCRPITFDVVIHNDGTPRIDVRAEDD